MNLEQFEGNDQENMQITMMKISHLYFEKIFQQLIDTEVHPGQLPMIRLLGEGSGLSQHEIAARLRIKPPTVNVSIKRMEKAGFVERRSDEADTRVNKIFLTQKGMEFHKKMRMVVQQNESVLLQGFTESEVCLLKRFFEQIIRNLEEMPTKITKTR
ncbi:MAG: MarR family transcriptional regulator [Lachnospiraceae bacterium]